MGEQINHNLTETKDERKKFKDWRVRLCEGTFNLHIYVAVCISFRFFFDVSLKAVRRLQQVVCIQCYVGLW